MSLLFIDGFDAGDFAQKWSNFFSGGAATSTNTPYGSGSSVRTSGTGGQVNKLSKVITPSAKFFVGFNYNTDFLGTHFFISSADGGAVQHIVLSTSGSGAIQIQRGATVVASSAGSVIATNVWNYIEVSGTVSDTTGTVEVRVNSAVVATFTGDTRNGGTSTNIDLVGIGSNNLTGTSYFDNFYVCNDAGVAPYNTYLGDIRINTLVPNGAGSSTGFTPSTGANYTTVDELPFSATDYVTASASGTRDLYTMSDLSGSYNVLAVQNNVIVKKTDAGGTALKPAIKSGATIYYGTSQTITPSDATVMDLRTADPATAAAWTITGVNALEAGMEIA
jgi:hypothetical protein